MSSRTLRQLFATALAAVLAGDTETGRHSADEAAECEAATAALREIEPEFWR